MIAVTAKTKPVGDGRVERYWREDDLDKRGLLKSPKNINRSGRKNSQEMKMSEHETLLKYKFRGFEFGNWVSQAERYDMFKAFQGCCEDISKFLKTENLGFDNQLAVAFGARGMGGGAKAHYEPALNVVNMTKTKGAGSFLHEYAHALDYCIGAYIDQNKRYTALSGGTTTAQEKDNVGGQFRFMMNKILLYVRSTEYYKTLKLMTGASMYWCNSTELWARLVEAYFGYFYNGNSAVNYYLVKPSKTYLHNFVYMKQHEIMPIKEDLDAFFKEVSKLLNGNTIQIKPMGFPVSASQKGEFYNIYECSISKGINGRPDYLNVKVYKDSHKQIKYAGRGALQHPETANATLPLYRFTLSEADTMLKKIVKKAKDPDKFDNKYFIKVNSKVWKAVRTKYSLLLHYEYKNEYGTEWEYKYYYIIVKEGDKVTEEKKDEIFAKLKKLARRKGSEVVTKAKHKVKKSALKKTVTKRKKK